jgi:3',5'-cyclic-nucleotide phosphodiesterase
MPTFDLVVVGSGGGPYETNLSSYVLSFFPLAKGRTSVPTRSNRRKSWNRYLFKPCDASWKDGMIALEAGEAQTRILRHAVQCSSETEAFPSHPRFALPPQARG